MSAKRAAALLVFCALLAGAAGSAQETSTPQKPTKEKPYALIFGTVFSPDDRPAYGARVQIRYADGRKVKGGETLTSDHQGEFALRVPAAPADYVVRAVAKTGKRKLSGETKVHINFDERADIGLHLTE